MIKYTCTSVATQIALSHGSRCQLIAPDLTSCKECISMIRLLQTKQTNGVLPTASELQAESMYEYSQATYEDAEFVQGLTVCPHSMKICRSCLAGSGASSDEGVSLSMARLFSTSVASNALETT